MIYNMIYGSGEEVANLQATSYKKTLDSDKWVNGTQTISVDGVTEDSTIFVGPDTDSVETAMECGVYCSGFTTNSLVFSCEETPEMGVVMNVFVVDGGEEGEEEPYVPPTWGGGTAEEIAEALTKHYAGEIDLTDQTNEYHWSVGDTRSVTLNGESQELVIMNIGGKELTTPVNGKSTCAFVVGLKNCMKNTQSVGNSWTSSASWSSRNNIRTWCNSTFKGYIDNILPNVFKQFKTITGISSSLNETVDDYFALPAEKEAFGSRTNSFEAEANALSQFTWYVTSSNRVKTVNGSASEWWERSPYYYDTSYWCTVSNGGYALNKTNAYSSGVSPFGCI